MCGIINENLTQHLLSHSSVRCPVEMSSNNRLKQKSEDMHRNKAREIDLDKPILADL